MNRSRLLSLAAAAVLLLVPVTFAQTGFEDIEDPDDSNFVLDPPDKMPLMSRFSHGGKTAMPNSQSCRVFRDRVEISQRIGLVTTTQLVRIGDVRERQLFDVIDEANRVGIVVGDPQNVDGPFTSYYASRRYENDIPLQTLTRNNKVGINPSESASVLRWMLDTLCGPTVAGR